MGMFREQGERGQDLADLVLAASRMRELAPVTVKVVDAYGEDAMASEQP